MVARTRSDEREMWSETLENFKPWQHSTLKAGGPRSKFQVQKNCTLESTPVPPSHRPVNHSEQPISSTKQTAMRH